MLTLDVGGVVARVDESEVATATVEVTASLWVLEVGVDV